jgi:hypothetical protein
MADENLNKALTTLRKRGEEIAARKKEMLERGGQLPLWPDPVRGVPNSILRSALFGVLGKAQGDRVMQDWVKKASIKGIDISVTGKEMDQGDLDVWEQCLHLARTSGLGAQIQFSAHGFLKAIKRTTAGKNHAWLIESLRRISSTTVEIGDGRYKYVGHLIDHWRRDDVTGHHVIELNPRIANMYDANSWTFVEFEQRMALRGKQLAQWLHGFYSTHYEPFGYKFETLYELSGSKNASLRDFKRSLKNAIAEVSAVTNWGMYIDDRGILLVNKRLGIGLNNGKKRKK